VENRGLSYNMRSDCTVDYEIEKAEKEAHRIATECHKMLSANHVHQETLVLPIEEHATMLSDIYFCAAFNLTTLDTSIQQNLKAEAQYNVKT
jgi:hypothetical protein